MLVSQMPLFFLVVPHHADIILLGNKTKWEGKKKKKEIVSKILLFIFSLISKTKKKEENQ